MTSLFSNPMRKFSAAFLTVAAHIAIFYGVATTQPVVAQPPVSPKTMVVAFKTISKPKPKAVIQHITQKPQPKKVVKKPARKKIIKKSVKKKIIQKKLVRKIVRKSVKKSVKNPPLKKIVSKKEAPIVIAKAAPQKTISKPAVKTSKPNIGNKPLYVKSAPRPKYPSSARRLGQEAIIKVSILVGINGKPKDVQMKSPSRYAKLNMAAMKTARLYRFSPAIIGGQKTEQWVTLPIQFILR